MRRSILAFFPLVLLALAALAPPALADDAPPASASAAPTPAPAATTSPQAAAAVAKVQAFYDQSQSFQSDFTQEFWVKAYNQKKESRGHVTFSKPGKMEWVYDEPKDNRVVSDGTTLKVYEAANKQMFEQGVVNSQYPAALAFLTGQGRLANLFNFAVYPGAQMNFPGGDVLVGTPQQATPAYQKVLFYIDSQSSQVRRVLVLDGQGNRNRFDFVNPRVNDPVPDARFHFTPPAGTSIIRP